MLHHRHLQVGLFGLWRHKPASSPDQSAVGAGPAPGPRWASESRCIRGLVRSRGYSTASCCANTSNPSSSCSCPRSCFSLWTQGQRQLERAGMWLSEEHVPWGEEEAQVGLVHPNAAKGRWVTHKPRGDSWIAALCCCPFEGLLGYKLFRQASFCMLHKALEFSSALS